MIPTRQVFDSDSELLNWKDVLKLTETLRTFKAIIVNAVVVGCLILPPLLEKLTVLSLPTPEYT